MGATNSLGVGWDEALHNLDGSHKITAPTTEPDSLAAWQGSRKAHIDLHIREAKEANEPLRRNGDAELADLADQVAEATEGGVYFVYSTSPSGSTFYVFQRIDGKRSRSAIISELHRVMHQPRGL